ncbi:MAG TPA: DUF3127 domain-containing protein [Candidatus Scalindua sp.]|nr:DUF3127 domain-containing protein [Candidatus Scalindua sp.]
MSYEVTGNIEFIHERERLTDTFTKRQFVVETVSTNDGKTYTNYVKMQVFNDKCALLDGLELGDGVKVTFDIGGRKYQVEGDTKYYTDLRAWKIEKV